jgi:hypothetical protein
MMRTKPLVFMLPQSPAVMHDHVDFMPKSSCKLCVGHKVKWAFTLIGPLVVITIAIFQAILLPALSRSKFKTKTISFISNFRQWTLVTIVTNMYASGDPQEQIVSCHNRRSPQLVLAVF